MKRDDSRASRTASDADCNPADYRGYLDLGMVAQPVLLAHGNDTHERRMQSGNDPQAQRQ